MKKFELIGSLAALLIAAPLAAQGRASAAGVPPGHLPPPGMCRIWIDGVPPGHQPAPTDCSTAVARRPANSRVIWGDQTPHPGKGKAKKGGDDRDRYPVDGRNLPWPIGSGDTRTEETRTEEKSRRDRPVYGGVYGIPRRPTDDGLRLNSTSETTTTKAKATKVKGKKKGGT